MAICLLPGLVWASEDFRWEVPVGFPPPLVPDAGLPSNALVTLGRTLFGDVRLSANQSIACISCHNPAHAYAGSVALPVGVDGQHLSLNAPGLLNVAYRSALGWQPAGPTSLEVQMLIPLFACGPREMGIAGKEDMVMGRLLADPDVRAGLQRAFDGARPRFEHVIKAIAAFERTLLSASSAYDRYVFFGETMDDAEMRGMDLFFGEPGCGRCHGGITFDNNFVRIAGRAPKSGAVTRHFDMGVGGQGEPGAFASRACEIPGLASKPQIPGSAGSSRFRVPGLRNLALTAPYMHDGSIMTLDSVLDHYVRGTPSTPPLQLDTSERSALISFLLALTDETLPE